MKQPLTRGKYLTIVYCSMLATLIFAAILSVYTANYVVKANQKAQAQASATALAPVCEYLKATEKVYQETPPLTPAGINQAKSVSELIIKFGCK